MEYREIPHCTGENSSLLLSPTQTTRGYASTSSRPGRQGAALSGLYTHLLLPLATHPGTRTGTNTFTHGKKEREKHSACIAVLLKQEHFLPSSRNIADSQGKRELRNDGQTEKNRQIGPIIVSSASLRDPTLLLFLVSKRCSHSILCICLFHWDSMAVSPISANA